MITLPTEPAYPLHRNSSGKHLNYQMRSGSSLCVFLQPLMCRSLYGNFIPTNSWRDAGTRGHESPANVKGESKLLTVFTRPISYSLPWYRYMLATLWDSPGAWCDRNFGFSNQGDNELDKSLMTASMTPNLSFQ